MTMSIPGAITGATVPGFTAPVYNLIADTAPDNNAKQSAVLSLGGTQAGVSVHSVSSPFTLSVFRPKVLQGLGKPDPATGLVRVPSNTYKVLTRKGVVPAASQPAKPMILRTEVDVPAGADTYDIANIKAAISLHIGALWAFSTGLSDTASTGVI